MNKQKPASRTEALILEETKHLNKREKQALDILADVEHLDGQSREELTEQSKVLADTKDKKPNNKAD